MSRARDTASVKRYVDKEVVSAGVVMTFARNTPPDGWLKANGATISRTAYANLFAMIGTTYGAGDGSTTFQLPDLRGEFIRNWDDGRGVDSGRGFGTFQNYDWKGVWFTNSQTASYGYSHYDQYSKSVGSYSGALFIGYWSAPAAALGMRFDESEVRSRNVSLLACIKY